MTNVVDSPNGAVEAMVRQLEDMHAAGYTVKQAIAELGAIAPTLGIKQEQVKAGAKYVFDRYDRRRDLLRAQIAATGGMRA